MEEAESVFTLSPNPAHDEFVVESSKFIDQIIIYDLTGREMYQQTLNSKLETLNPKLSAGIYLVQVRNDQRSYTQMLVVE